MIVSTQLRAAFDERPGKTHLMAGYYQLRPNLFLELYVSTALWSEYIKTLPPEKDSAAIAPPDFSSPRIFRAAELARLISE
jgi:hypothetical protein